MAQPYWIDDNLNIWTKTSISANSSTVLYVRKQDGYSPDGSQVFEFFDDFDTDRGWTLFGSNGAKSYSIQNSILTLPKLSVNVGGLDEGAYFGYSIPTQCVIQTKMKIH
jgi:hypothetical protein